jgi:hypothetical protein
LISYTIYCTKNTPVPHGTGVFLWMGRVFMQQSPTYIITEELSREFLENYTTQSQATSL